MIEQQILAADTAGAVGGALGRITFYCLLLLPGVVLVTSGLRERNQARRARSTGDHLPTNKSSSTRKIIGGVIAFLFGLFLILGGAIMSGVNKARQGEARQGEALQVARDLSVGECITSSDFLAKRGNAEPINCASEAAKYEVAFVGGGAATCPDGKREDSLYSVLATSSQTLCFIANFSEGSCYSIVEPLTGDHPLPESCTSPQANMRVDRRIDGTTDKARCPEGSVGASYPQPPRLFCFGPLS